MSKTNESSVETLRSGDEWVRFTTCGATVRVETSDGEDSSLSESDAAERMEYVRRWGYR
jgi:hypothetical protein